MALTHRLTSFSLVILFFSTVLYLFWNGRGNAKEFQIAVLNNASVENAKVLSVEYKNKSGYKVAYSFVHKGTVVSGYNIYADFGNLRNVVVNRYFPVIYNRLNPQQNDILIVPEEFRNYRMDYPDSLNWVLTYLK